MNPIDQQFRQQLHAHSSIPTSDMWDRLEQSLDQTPKATPVWAWWTGALVALLLASGMLLSYSLDANEAASHMSAKEDTGTLEIPISVPEKETMKPAAEKIDIPVMHEKKLPVYRRGKAKVNTLPIAEVSNTITTEENLLAPLVKDESDALFVSTPIEPRKTDILPLEGLPRLKLAMLSMGQQQLALPEGCYSFGKKSSFFGGLHLYVDAYGGPDYAGRSLAANDSETANYAQKRDSMETTLVSATVGARLGFQTELGITGRIGFQYSQINERLDYMNGSESRVIYSTILNPDGSILRIDTTTETGVRNKKTYNRIKMIDLPITVGYESDADSDFGWGVQVGAGLNMWSRRQGEIVDPVQELPVFFTDGNPNQYPVFKDQFGLFLTGSVTFRKSLTDRLSVFAEPTLRYYMKPFTQDSYPVEQRYVTGGLYLGLRCSL